jgi:ATP-binding cassette subfamily B protein
MTAAMAAPAGVLDRLLRYPFVRAVRACWRASPTLTALLLGIAVTSGFIPLALYVAFAIFAGAVASPTPPWPIELGALAVVGVFLLLQVRTPLTHVFIGRLARRLDTWLQRRVMAASLGPRTIDHVYTPAFDAAATAARGWESHAHPPADAAWSIVYFVQNLIVAVGSAVLILQFAWWAPIVLGLGFLLLGVWGTRVREGPDLARGRGDTALRRSTYLRELVFQPAAGREARLFGLSGWLRERSDAHWRDAMHRVWAARTDTWLLAVVSVLVLVGSHLLVFGLIAQAMLEHRVDVTQAALYIQGAGGLVNLWMPWVLVALREATMPLAVVDALPEPRPAALGTPADGKPAQSIAFRSMSFAYPGQRDPVFDRLDLEIRAGESIAIVGPNGAGKTTLVKLLCGLLEPTSGRIEIDGVDLRTIDRAGWQGRVAAIFQDYVRYPFSARDNILLGRRASTEEALERAVVRAGAEELVADLPQGLETPLAREFGGIDLSGGQWQRVALARALYAVERGAGVLILDEPTAQLDVRAEAELFDRFLDLTAGLTTILISHRFSSVRHASRIVVLEGGRVVEDGSHATLLAAPTRYAELFHLQARHFEHADA